MKLEYSQPVVSPSRRGLRDMAFFMSLTLVICLAVSVGMYLWAPVFRGLQVALAWISITLAVPALVLASVVFALNVRGRREIAALVAAVVHAAMVLAALKYL